MAISRVAERSSQTTSNGTGATSLACDMPSAGSITVGNHLILRFSVNNSVGTGQGPGVTISDPRSNLWEILPDSTADPGATNAGVSLYVAICKVTNAYTDGDDITLNLGATAGGRNAVIDEWSGIRSPFPFSYPELYDNETANFATGITKWTTDANSAIAEETGTTYNRPRSLKITSSAAGNYSARTTDFFSVTAGRVVRAAVMVRAAATARTIRVAIEWYTSGDVLISEVNGTDIASTTSGWTEAYADLLAPATTAKCKVVVYALSAAGASEVQYVGAATLGEIARLTSGTATPTSGDFTPGSVGAMVMAAVAVEGPLADTYTEDADTTDGSWVALGRQGGSNATATANTTVEGGYKIVTGTSAQSHAATITTRDWAELITAFAPTPLAPLPPPVGVRHAAMRHLITR